jgi:hypothetical protein
MIAIKTFFRVRKERKQEECSYKLKEKNFTSMDNPYAGIIHS